MVNSQYKKFNYSETGFQVSLKDSGISDYEETSVNKKCSLQFKMLKSSLTSESSSYDREKTHWKTIRTDDSSTVIKTKGIAKHSLVKISKESASSSLGIGLSEIIDLNLSGLEGVESSGDNHRIGVFSIHEEDVTADDIETAIDSIREYLDLLINFYKTDSDEIQNQILDIHNLIKNGFSSPKNLKKLFDLSLNKNGTVDLHKLAVIYNTLIEAEAESGAFTSQAIRLERDIYFGKKFYFKDNIKHLLSYSFKFTKDRELIISTDKIAEGSSKKVNYAFNLTTGEDLIKSTIIGREKIRRTKKEFKTQLDLAEKSFYIHKPLTDEGMIVLRKKDYAKTRELTKLILFDKKLEGDGLLLTHANENQMFNAFLGVLEGLKFLHDNNLVHMDVRPENFLIEDFDQGIIKLSDFGGIQKNGDSITTFSKQFVSKDLLDKLKKSKAAAKPEYDDFAAGITFLILIRSFLDEPYDNFMDVLELVLKNDILDVFFDELAKKMDDKDSLRGNADKSIVLKMLDVAKKLTAPLDSKEHLDTQGALEELRKIEKIL